MKNICIKYFELPDVPKKGMNWNCKCKRVCWWETTAWIYFKKESSSPTVSTYALFILYAIDTIEGHKVVICDNPGAFLQTNWPEGNYCNLKFGDLIVKMICNINPSYKKDILTNRTTGKRRNCMENWPSVYGTLLGATLFYQKLSRQLEWWGLQPEQLWSMHIQQDHCAFL